MANPAIETAPERKCCKWCGKRLRPKYNTTFADGGFRWRKAAAHEVRDPSDPYKRSGGDPTNPDHEVCDVYHYSSEYDEERGHWMIKISCQRVKERKFLGKYGWNEFFCNPTCASYWGLANVRAIFERDETINKTHYFIKRVQSTKPIEESS